MTSHSDPLGRLTEDSYDETGDKTTEVIVVGTDAEATTISQYDKGNHLTKLIDPDSNTTWFAFDKAGDQTWTRDPLGHTAVFGYDLDQRMTSTIDRAGRTIR